MANETMMMKFVEILRNNPNHAYDFISQNAWNFSKDELRDIIKEFLYAVSYDSVERELVRNEILNDVAEELNDMYSEE